MTDKDDMMHQGKTISQWVKDFKGEFTYDQLMKMAKGGADLQKILMLGLDEAEDIDDKRLFKDEEFFFNESDRYGSPKIEFVIYDQDENEVSRNLIKPADATFFNLMYLSNCADDMNDAAKAMPNSIHQTATIFVDDKPLSNISTVRKAQLRRLNLNETADEEAALGEIHENRNMLEHFNSDAAITVGDFQENLERSLAKDSDKIMFRVNKKPYEVFDMHAKGGTCVIDLIPQVANELNESEPAGDFMNVSDLRRLGQRAYPRSKDAWQYETIIGVVNGKVVDFKEVEHFKPDYPSEGTFFLLDGSEASHQAYEKEVDVMMSESSKNMNEGRNWRTGGYGGYGRSYQSYGELGAPRGKAISWFSVDELDPKAKGKMNDWRVGPSNFPFNDLLYPNRKYKVGTTVLRSKFLKAGDESGVKYIAVPSYLDSIRNNDEAAIELLKSLGIPLDLTFGYSPNEDFSSTYTIASK